MIGIWVAFNGDSNTAFYKEFAAQKLKATQIPIMAFSVAEDELLTVPTENLVGHLAAWNYYQSLDTPDNKKFVEAFKKKYGEKRVTDDPIEAAYFGVYVWKAAVEKAQSFDVEAVKAKVLGLEFDAPGGKKHMHATNHHTAKPVYIGKIRADGQFDIVSKYKDGALVEPESYSSYLPKEEAKPAEGAKKEEPAKGEPAKKTEPAKK
jgi:urea transport system substrate-binding protein